MSFDEKHVTCTMMKHPILQCPFSHSWNTWIKSFIPLYHIDGSKRAIALKYNNVYDPRCGLIRVTKDKVRDTCHLYKILSVPVPSPSSMNHRVILPFLLHNQHNEYSMSCPILDSSSMIIVMRVERGLSQIALV